MSSSTIFAKICIVVEEADETVFWLEMIEALNLGNYQRLQELIKEGNEILFLASKSKKTVDNKITKK